MQTALHICTILPNISGYNYREMVVYSETYSHIEIFYLSVKLFVSTVLMENN